MATRKLVRDVFLSKRLLYRHVLAYSQGSRPASRLRLLGAGNGYREFSVFSEFSKKVKGEVNSNQEFQKTVKELKEKTEELKGVKEDLKVRTKQTTEELYKHVDGAWTEAEATAKKVSENLKEKVSAAKEEVKETLGLGKQESKESSSSTNDESSGKFGKDYKQSEGGEDKKQESGYAESAEAIFGKVRSGVSSSFQKAKDAKVIDLAKKGYDIVKDELSGSPSKRKRAQAAYAAASQANVEKSTRTDLTIVPVKQSRFSKKWETLKAKMQGHPVFKRFTGLSEPVVTKSQEIAEDMRERWETSDSRVVHKLHDINESVFKETDAAMSFKEIRRRDPYFSLPDFVSDVQEIVSPVLKAYIKGESEVLEKYCSPEIVERCKAEHRVCEQQGTFYDNKILHISEVDVRETKMMGDSPLIIIGFQTQQVYCVRDRLGEITEGGKDTIHTVHYLWAMQLSEPDEGAEGAHMPIWKLRDMQQVGIRALI
ncbi:mitochondrial import inner membrane translocase subunit TIM44-2-like [Rutidosis leptorrhynchoides]|uniref:mitochondrial import inner membrane translocase subunit TIM44-2-like n=1 Tax=Rutidosis leptorrhynchoides TaxID=125765 RepID=UPI003A991B33